MVLQMGQKSGSHITQSTYQLLNEEYLTALFNLWNFLYHQPLCEHTGENRSGGQPDCL